MSAEIRYRTFSSGKSVLVMAAMSARICALIQRVSEMKHSSVIGGVS